MTLGNSICSIDIKVDETYSINLFSKGYSIALIGPYYTYDSDCAVLDGEKLTVLQDHTITEINIIDGSIIRHAQFDCFGCCFGIYRVKMGYIIYGEMEIIMLDFDLVKKWSFSGRDIFVSLTNKNPFELRENSICLYDFEDNYYEIDYDGKQLDEAQ